MQVTSIHTFQQQNNAINLLCVALLHSVAIRIFIVEKYVSLKLIVNLNNVYIAFDSNFC